MSELATLCQTCGLCCDGSLFGRVPLAPEEVEGARRRRLHVLDTGASFEQPCSALTGEGEDRRCAVYEARPRACASFVCRLYERHRHEGGPLEPRLVAVRRVRELLARLDAQGLAPDDFAELQRHLDDDFARA